MPPSGSYFGGPFKRVNGAVVSTDPIVAPSVNGISLSPDGSTLVADRPIMSPRLLASTGAERLAKTGRRVLIVGSSSSVNCSTVDVLAASNSEFNEYWAGYWAWANVACAGDFSLVYNSSFGGSGDSASLNRLTVALASYASLVDIVIIQFGASDIQNTTFDMSITLRAAKLALSYGKIIVVDVPHSWNPQTVPLSKYDTFRTYIMENIISKYPGRAYLADRFAHLTERFGFTPPEWLSPDGKHLNHLGAYHAGTEAYAPALRAITGPALPFPGPRNGYGTAVATLNGATATAFGCTVTSIDATPEEIPQWEIVSNADSAGARLELSVTGLSTGKKYRPLYDYDIIDAAAVPLGSSTVGGKWDSPNRRFGPGTLGGMESVLPTNVPIQTMSAEFTPTGTSGKLIFYVGNTGAKVRMRSITLYESP